MSVIVRNPTIAAFDFDGTLTRGESFFRFLFFVTPWWRFLFCLLRSLPVLLMFLLRLTDNESAKVKVLGIFLGGRPRQLLEREAERFAELRIPATLRPEAVAKLRGHQKQGHVCVLVSATLALYLRPWARDMGFDEVLATELEVDARGRFTGRLATPNCYGPEKAARLRQRFGCERVKAAYGDSAGDTEMLAMAEDAYYRPWQ
ncbi:HAD-IB family hydrolase [Amnimonas aquatica]|uniref:HAD-IB family hydrolase n=1 Tax=Amnimonas aquatica TaxID=2094561 RepID=A0A2P6AVD0_9GAMM|nr:HAD-IB family hydrolase [Amnimonas aquatica]PQA52223.1 HAD-IB family hydrolase [Amnimonas aquatica]